MLIYPPKTKHGVRSWWSNFYWTSIFLFFTNWEKNGSRTGVTIICCTKPLARLLYKLRCEDYFTQVKPHQYIHPTHIVAQTWYPTLQGSYLQTHHHRVSSERIDLAYKATNLVWLAQLIHPRKSWKIQLLQKRKPTLKKVQQQHLHIMKFIIIKSLIHISNILEW